MNTLSKALTVIILSGLGYFFSASFGTIWFLIWLAPIPVLIYSYTENKLKITLVAFIIGLAPGINEIIGYWSTQIPLQGLIQDTFLKSALWTVAVLLNSILVKKIRTPISLLAYPTLFTLIEWLQSLSTQSSFTTIAYSQIQFLPAMQIASVTGFLGVTFVLSLFASTLAYTFTFHKTVYKSWTVVIVSLSFVLGSLGYGFYRIETYQGDAISGIKVGLASINTSPKDIFNPIKACSLLEGYRPLIQKLSQQGSKIILLPEEILSVNPSNNEQIKSELALLARQNEITLIVGVNELLQKDKRSNNVWIFNPQGSLIGTYGKQHLVPGLEDEVTPGINLLSFPLNNSNASVAICRDLDYTDPAHVYGQRDTNILFVPAWDFEVDARVHAAGAITRGIENGYTIVRSARGGYLSITSPTGHVIAEALAIEKNGNVLIGEAFSWQNSSFYAKHKYSFICVLMVLMLFLIRMFLISTQALKQVSGLIETERLFKKNTL